MTDSNTDSSPTPKKRKKRVKVFLIILSLFSFIALPALGLAIYVINIYPDLPDASSLKDVSYQVPLRITSSDGKLISEIGTKKRIPLAYADIPEKMSQAIISAEDSNFFRHGGVDYKGLARAAYELITTGKKKSGGSTITMQVARNFFLSKEKTYLRKLNEIVLSYKIEHQISKQEIIALYLNKIFLGYRSYGVAAAAQTYYGKNIKDLSLDEYAMIAGLPKAPSRFNPIYNPERAKLRRNYVLRRMHEKNHISEEEMKLAQMVPVHAKLTGARIDIEAGYVAEMARTFAIEKFGEDALKNGLTITTTIDSKLQYAANQAIRHGLQNYERRHGYRGVILHLEDSVLKDPKTLNKALDEIEKYGDLNIAVITKTEKNKAFFSLENTETGTLTLNSIKWARPYINVNKLGSKIKKITDVLKTGDVIYLHKVNEKWQLAQNPKIESALVSINSKDGKIKALVGGYDFFRSKFNRVTQAKRQIGSNIKPFLYSAAFEHNMTAASIINDAPVVFHDRNLEDVWRPENSSGRFYGPTRLRTALTHSRNLVSVRLLRKIKIKNAIKHINKFGFDLTELKKHQDLSLALGSVEFTPLKLVTAYAALSNTGHLIKPYLIENIKDYDGSIIYQAEPVKVCSFECVENDTNQAPKIVSEQNIYITNTILQDVINYGTAKKAKVLKRKDLAGKTGTTNDLKDAWFSGFNPNIATTVWVGFDTPSTLGRKEFGGRAALPIWIDYMKTALTDEVNTPLKVPGEMVNILIDKSTGEAVPSNTQGAIYEVFRKNNAPKVPDFTQESIEEMAQELFE